MELLNKIASYLIAISVMYLLLKFIPKQSMNNQDILMISVIIVLLYNIMTIIYDMVNKSERVEGMLNIGQDNAHTHGLNNFNAQPEREYNATIWDHNTKLKTEHNNYSTIKHTKPIYDEHTKNHNGDDELHGILSAEPRMLNKNNQYKPQISKPLSYEQTQHKCPPCPPCSSTYMEHADAQKWPESHLDLPTPQSNINSESWNY